VTAEPPPTVRLSELLGSRVIDADGSDRGRVLDVRARRHGHGFRVEGLVLGAAGLRARLGLRAARDPQPLHRREVVPWERVARLAPGEVHLTDARRA